MRTFPELESTLNEDLKIVWKNKEYTEEVVDKSCDSVMTYCKGVFPERFFDILYQNEEMFINPELNLCFLPGVDYRSLWKEDISDQTRETIWKYLQLFLFSILSNVKDGKTFGDTADLFKAINEDVFKTKLESTINEMKDMFSKSDTGEDANVQDTIPDAQSIHDHVTGMMDGKLGSLAKEIAEETAADMDLDMNDVTSVNDVFSSLLKDPSKLMSMIKNVGSKLDDKIKSGEIKESELLEEASEMMKKMKTMPGMENMQSLLSKMGLGGKGKINHTAMQAQMDRNIKQAKQKEKMRNKAEQNKKSSSTQSKTPEEVNTAYHESEKVVNELLKDYEDQILRSGEKAERSSKKQNIKGNKKMKGKKHK
jgi:hypothetical protein